MFTHVKVLPEGHFLSTVITCLMVKLEKLVTPLAKLERNTAELYFSALSSFDQI